MTPQQAKEILPIITAYAEGKRIEILNQNGQWRDETEYGYGFCLERSRYRIKPEPKTRPWSKPEDVPGPVCWLRDNRLIEHLVFQVDATGVCIVGKEYVFGHGDFKNLEYSTSRERGSWRKCEVTEEVQ